MAQVDAVAIGKAHYAHQGETAVKTAIDEAGNGLQVSRGGVQHSVALVNAVEVAVGASGAQAYVFGNNDVVARVQQRGNDEAFVFAASCELVRVSAGVANALGAGSQGDDRTLAGAS